MFNPATRPASFFLFQVQRNVDDHIFLTANHAPTAQLNQDFARIHSVVFGGLFGVAKKGRINAGIT